MKIPIIILTAFSLIVNRLAETYLTETVSVIPHFLSLQLFQDYGFRGYILLFSPWAVVIQTVSLVIFSVLYFKTPKQFIGTRLGLGLIVAGSLSNLLDRIPVGHYVDSFGVPDYIILEFMPNIVFNVADLMIVLGLVIFAIVMFSWLFKGKVMENLRLWVRK